MLKDSRKTSIETRHVKDLLYTKCDISLNRLELNEDNGEHSEDDEIHFDNSSQISEKNNNAKTEKKQKSHFKIAMALSSKYITSFQKYYTKYIDENRDEDPLEVSKFTHFYDDEEFRSYLRTCLENELDFVSMENSIQSVSKKINGNIFDLSAPNCHLAAYSKLHHDKYTDWNYMNDLKSKCSDWMSKNEKYLHSSSHDNS